MLRILTLISAVLLFALPASAEMKRISTDPSLQKTASMISATIEIDAPIAQVWELVGTKFDDSAAFNPDAQSTAFINGGPTRVGAQRRTIDTKGTFVDVEVFDFHPSAHLIAWEIIATDLAPISFGYSQYQLKALGPTRTSLTQIAGFKMGGMIMDVMMRTQFPSALQTELSALKRLAETGERVATGSARQIKEDFGANIVTEKSW